MGMPEDGPAKQLVWGERINPDWQCLILVEAKDLCNSFTSHLTCFLFIWHTAINLGMATEGLKAHSAVTVLQPLLLAVSLGDVPSHCFAPDVLCSPVHY